MRTDILQQAQAIRASMDAAAGAAQIGKAEPVAEAGLFAAALEPWQAGTSYAKGAAFVHNGAVYFARQAVVSAKHQQPGSTGMEAIYGVRPIPDGQRPHG